MKVNDYFPNRHEWHLTPRLSEGRLSEFGHRSSWFLGDISFSPEPLMFSPKCRCSVNFCFSKTKWQKGAGHIAQPFVSQGSQGFGVCDNPVDKPCVPPSAHPPGLAQANAPSYRASAEAFPVALQIFLVRK